MAITPEDQLQIDDLARALTQQRDQALNDLANLRVLSAKQQREAVALVKALQEDLKAAAAREADLLKQIVETKEKFVTAESIAAAIDKKIDGENETRDAIRNGKSVGNLLVQ